MLLDLKLLCERLRFAPLAATLHRRAIRLRLIILAERQRIPLAEDLRGQFA